MRIVEPLLGTRAEVQVTAPSQAAADNAEQAMLDEAARLEQIFTVFNAASPLYELRRSGETSVPELQQVLALAEHWRQRTGGAFNPSMQPLMDRWQQAELDGAAPSSADLAELVDRLAAAGQTANLNLNAIAKGWIAQRALGAVAEKQPEISASWLSLGGDVVHRGEGSVRVGIEDPRRPYDNLAPLATVTLANAALATSGNARRWWTIGDDRYAKVLDPRNGHPVERVASATVVADDGATADVLATVALVLPVDETFALVHEAGAVCFVVEMNGAVSSSSDRFRVS